VLLRCAIQLSICSEHRVEVAGGSQPRHRRRIGIEQVLRCRGIRCDIPVQHTGKHAIYRFPYKLWRQIALVSKVTRM